MHVESEHTLKDKKQRATLLMCPRLIFFLLLVKVPCGQEQILFRSHVLFLSTCPLAFFFYKLAPCTLPLF